MDANRRQLLRTATAVAAGLGVAGCSSSTDDATPTDEGTGTPGSTDDGSGEDGSTSVGASAAVAAEWTVMRARLDDAYALGLAGMTDEGATVAGRTFERFEGASGEYGAHEYLEETSTANYEGFESGIVDLEEGLSDGDLDGAKRGWRTAHQHLREAQLAVVGEAGANALGVLRFGAAVDDVELVAAAGESEGAASVAGTVQSWFEDAPEHGALESADGDAYERLEGAMEDAKSAADGGDLAGVRSASDAAVGAAVSGAEAIASADLAAAGHLAVYQAQGWDAAVLASLDGSTSTGGDAATTIVDGVFERFEENTGDIHETLEEADRGAYENFEAGLDSLSTALSENGDVRAAASAYADATLRAQFAVVGALDEAPVDRSGESSGQTRSYAGGPNVQEGVPSDADHVIDMNLVAFDPAELTVQTGETVAWKHAEGEPHTVTAYEEKVPSGADYWNSGGFDSESAAREGWEDGDTAAGAVQSGRSYVHTFETAGTHEYYCIPHEGMGMKGTVTVEE